MKKQNTATQDIAFTFTVPLLFLNNLKLVGWLTESIWIRFPKEFHDMQI